MLHRLRTAVYLLLCISVAAPTTLARADIDALLLLKQPNHFAMIRHALAPGTGDPSDFKVGDCSTQRNLDDQGRKQARSIGDIFKQFGFGQIALFSSQWCRCLDTATLMDLGEVNPQPLLNSFFADRSRAEDQTNQLKQWILQRQDKQPLVLVTHQVNISALTGSYTDSGEIIVIEIINGSDFAVVGSTRTR